MTAQPTEKLITLSISERINIGQFIPKNGNLIELAIIQALIKKVEVNQEISTKIGLRNQAKIDGSIDYTWQVKYLADDKEGHKKGEEIPEAKDITVNFSAPEIALIKGEIEKQSQEKSLPLNSYELIQKIQKL